ncbi:MAG: metalloregulator ArsR/SmtB family transcription factor [Desulfobacterales bacterium]|jgi:ArsR family transcriptional regulator
MQHFIQVMKALADASRVKIVKLLQRRSMCVCELQGLLGLAQPTVSKHLKVLEEAGLVVSSKDGLWVNYAPSDGSRSPYVASLLGDLRHWLEDDPAIRRALAQLPFVNRDDLCRRS